MFLLSVDGGRHDFMLEIVCYPRFIWFDFVLLLEIVRGFFRDGQIKILLTMLDTLLSLILS